MTEISKVIILVLSFNTLFKVEVFTTGGDKWVPSTF